MIQSHNFKPTPIFFVTDTEKNSNEKINEFIGIELEIIGEDKYTCAYELSNDNFFYCKNDMSIGSSGIEIVSHPASINYHVNSGKWKKVYEILDKTRMYNNEGCGLHFHVNKNGFTNESLSVLDYFVNNNQKMMEAFGDRNVGFYCRARNKRRSDWGKREVSEHCDSVNFSNENTVELRFFNSPIEYKVFLQKLFIVKNIILFVKQTSFKDIYSKNNIDLFIEYLDKNGFEESPYIKLFLKKNKII